MKRKPNFNEAARLVREAVEEYKAAQAEETEKAGGSREADVPHGPTPEQMEMTIHRRYLHNDPSIPLE